MNIWLLCGGPSVEHAVSLSSARVVARLMNLAGGRRVRPVVVSKAGRWLVSARVLSEGDVRGWLDGFFDAPHGAGAADLGLGEALTRMAAERVDLVLPIFHGEYGEDGRVQGLLDAAGIAYTGSGVLASAVAMSKPVSLATFAAAGLAIPRGVRVSRATPDTPALAALNPPLFAKPARGGSSLGVTLVKRREDLPAAVAFALSHDDEALVEERVVGKEVSCGVVDLIVDGRLVSTPMPPTLIEPTEAEFFDYDAKYTPGKSRDTTPAPLPAEVIKAIMATALAAHRALGCEGMSRTDMIVGDGEAGLRPVILETQTIPGLTPTSLLPQQCAVTGIDFAGLIDALIAHAGHRAGRPSSG